MKSKATTPTIGNPVRGSSTGKPIMVLLDLLGRRSTLRLIWELRNGDAMTFRALQSAADTNPSLLNTRIKELRTASILTHTGEGYSLTETGKSLIDALMPLTKWAEQWATLTKAQSLELQVST